MKRIYNLYSFLLISIILVIGASCTHENEDPIMTRDTDKLSIAYNEGATAELSVRYKGKWQAQTEADWLTLSPEFGESYNNEYQKLIITAKRNVSDKRTATIYLLPSEGEQLKVEITQEDGHFMLGEIGTIGEMYAEKESTLSISIPYYKAIGNENVEIISELNNSISGLSVENNKKVSISKEGDGNIYVPIKGIANQSGAIDYTYKVNINNKVAAEGELTLIVKSESEIQDFTFEKFIWGGDYINGKNGIWPTPTQPGKSYTGPWDQTGYTCTPGKDGAGDVFLSMCEDYRIARGMANWDGEKVYEKPGYIKIGTSKDAGWIMTPALNKIKEPGNYNLEIEMARFVEDQCTEIIVTAENEGNVINGLIDGSKLPTDKKEWHTLIFALNDATSATKIKIASVDRKAKNRFCIKRIAITGGVKARTEPLDNISEESIESVIGPNNIALSWAEIADASFYEITIADYKNPDFKKTITATTNNADLTGLNKNTAYIVTIQAIYEKDPTLNSEITSKILTTSTGFITLTTPKLKIFDKVTAHYAVIQIDDYKTDELTTSFDFILLKDNLEVQNYNLNISTTNQATYAKHGLRFQFSGLKPNTTYIAKIRRVAEDVTKYESSEFATIEFTTTADVDRSKYLVYNDFNNHPWGGNGPLVAFGIDPADKDKDFDVINNISKKGWKLATPPKNMDNMYNGVGYNVDGGQTYYHETFMPGWSKDYIKASTKIYLCAGIMKFGTGSTPGNLILPSVNESNISLNFDSSPFMVPNRENGSLEDANTLEGLDFVLELEGDGEIFIDGKLQSGKTINLKNKSPIETNAEKLGFISYTHHKFEIKGINSNTKIYIKTHKNSPRMWFDNLTIKKL